MRESRGNSVIFPLSPDSYLKTNEYSIYKEFLRDAFSDNEVRNIAVSGSFGVGKSSILRTFDNERNKRLIYISIMDEKSDEDSLEVTILRQILSHCYKDAFPKLRFNLIPEENENKILTTTILSSYIALLLLVLFSKKISDWFHFWGGDLKGYGTIGLDLIFFIASIVLIWKAINYGLTFLKVKNVDLKVESDKSEAVMSTTSYSESVFDEYRFDLIYVLEILSKEYDGIVFEDMDRIEKDKCISIFHQLREINLSLNVRRKMKNSPFRFVYVVNDEIMGDIKQTKFFDYIMSVFPSLGISNANEKFQNILLDELEIKNLNSEEIKRIFDTVAQSNELKDYRTLKHIKNEYRLLKKLSEESGIVIENCQGCLLAFIIYKVLLPKDYNLIRSGKSFVFPEWDDFKWLKYSGDEKNAIENLKPLLQNKNCLKFLGYSKEERIKYYSSVLAGKDIVQKRSLLNCDDDFICGEILCGNENEPMINDAQDDWIKYFIRHRAGSHYNETHYEKFVKMLVKSCNALDNDTMEELMSGVTFDLPQEKQSDVYAFAAVCLLKGGYTNQGDLDWFYTTEDENLKLRIRNVTDDLFKYTVESECFINSFSPINRAYIRDLMRQPEDV